MNDSMTVLAMTIFVADDRSVLDNGQSPSRAFAAHAFVCAYGVS
jgi:hypothetical protein